MYEALSGATFFFVCIKIAKSYEAIVHTYYETSTVLHKYRINIARVEVIDL